MQEKIMILGAGRGQVPLIKAAREMGYATVVTGIKGDYPGFALADHICYADISKPEEVAAAAKEYGVSAVVTACLDTGIEALGYTCEALGLNGLSKDAAKISQNKLLMKEAFMKHGVSTAKYKKISTQEELKVVLSELQFPMIVKAVDLQGSQGINIVRDKEELMRGYEQTMSATRKDFCIIEEFIEGDEFGAQAFVVDGEVLYILPCGDITYLGNTNVPVGHYAPLKMETGLQEQIEEEVKLAIKAVGLDNCAVNVDLLLRDGKVYVIELTGRIGANCLDQISSIYYGLDVYRLILDTAMGKDPTEYFLANKQEPTACYAKMLFSEEAGELEEIINKNEDSNNIVEISYFVKPGQMINKFRDSRDCIGQVVVKGSSLDECEKCIEEVVSNIVFLLK